SSWRMRRRTGSSPSSGTTGAGPTSSPGPTKMPAPAASRMLPLAAGQPDGRRSPRHRRAGPRSLAPAICLVLVGCVGLWPAPAQEGPIHLPPGFAIDVFAKELGHARFLAFDPRGTLLVSVPRAGRIVALPDRNGHGRADRVDPVVEGLDLPHGLAFFQG